MPPETIGGVPYNEYMRDYMRRRYVKRRARAIHMLGSRCVDCGTDDVEALEFDHDDRTTKAFTVANRLGTAPWRVIEAELRKCVLRCNACHLVKTIESDKGQTLKSEWLLAHRERRAS